MILILWLQFILLISAQNNTTDSNTPTTTQDSAQQTTQVVIDLNQLFALNTSNLSSLSSFENGYQSTIDIGSLSSWWGLTQSVRLAFMGQPNEIMRIFDNNGQFNYNSVLLTNIGITIGMAVALLMGSLVFCVTPCLYYRLFNGMLKKRRREMEKQKEREEREKLKSMPPKEREKKLKELYQMRKKRMAHKEEEEEDKIKIFTRSERLMAVFILIVTLCFCITFIILAYVGNSTADQSMTQFMALSDQVFDEMKDLTGQMNHSFTSAFDSQRFSIYSDGLLNANLSEMNSYLYQDINLPTQEVNDLSEQLQSFVDDFNQNGQDVLSLLAQMSSDLSALQLELSHPSEAFNDFTLNGFTCQFVQPSSFQILQNPPIELNVDDLPIDSLANQLSSFQSINLTLTASQLYQTSDTYMNAINQNFLNYLSTSLTNYGSSLSTLGQTSFARFSSQIFFVKYNASSNLQMLASVNGQRSVGVYTVTSLAFVFTVIIISIVLLGREFEAKCLNICNILFIVLFLFACAFCLGFAYFDANMCRAIRNDKFQNWTLPLQVQAGPSSLYPLDTWIPQMYNIREQCTYGNSKPLATLALQYVPTYLSSSEDPNAYMKTIGNSDTFADLFFRQLQDYFSQTGKNVVSDQVRSWQPTFRNVENLVSKTVGDFISLGDSIQYDLFMNAVSQDVYFVPEFQVMNQFEKQLQSFSSHLHSTDFQVAEAGATITPNDCLAQYPNEINNNISPAINNTIDTLVSRLKANQLLVQAKLNILRQDYLTVKNYQQNITSYLTSINSVTTQTIIYNSLLTTIFSSQPTSPFLYYMKTYLREFLGKVTEPLSSQLDCFDFGKNLYDAEELVCGPALAGLDAAYWAMGSLAVIYFFQYLTIKLCIDRLHEDNRWLVMAMLLKTNFKNPQNQQKQKNILKTNTTGTTYLEEQDFDLDFGDDSITKEAEDIMNNDYARTTIAISTSRLLSSQGTTRLNASLNSASTPLLTEQYSPQVSNSPTYSGRLPNGQPPSIQKSSTVGPQSPMNYGPMDSQQRPRPPFTMQQQQRQPPGFQQQQQQRPPSGFQQQQQMPPNMMMQNTRPMMRPGMPMGSQQQLNRAPSMNQGMVNGSQPQLSRSGSVRPPMPRPAPPSRPSQPSAYNGQNFQAD